MWKFQCLLLVMKRSYICYYMICMAVPRNKIVALKEFMWKKVGICVCSERKIDQTFPDQEYRVHHYKLCRSCRNKHGGGVIFYINENLPCKVVGLEEVPNDCEMILIEVSIKNRKSLSIGLYKSPLQNVSTSLTICHLSWISRNVNMIIHARFFVLKKLKILTRSNYHRVLHFLLKLPTRFLLTTVYKKVFRIFFILFRSCVICKDKKDLVFAHSIFTFLLLIQDRNKIKKISNTLLFVDIV